MKNNSLNYDIVIIGAGPAGLSLSIKLKQLAKINKIDISICIIEKSKKIGSHIISGGILEPGSLIKLFNNKKIKEILDTKVKEDIILFLTKNKSFKIPELFLPNFYNNNNNYIISLCQLVKWLSKEAEKLGIEIYTGFSAKNILFDKNNNVIGVSTPNTGLDKFNKPKECFQYGINIYSKYLILAEGARGYISKKIIKHFNLNNNKYPKNFSLGIKELWKLNPKKHILGRVIHMIGWPFNDFYNCGSFVYYFKNNLLSLGSVINLSYKNPYFSPYESFQLLKTHPLIHNILLDAKRIEYGARVINNSGLNSLNNLSFNGGILIGCSAGFLNPAKNKGIHTAIESGILGAESIFESLKNNKYNKKINFKYIFNKSNLYKELDNSKDIKFLINKGYFLGGILININEKIFKIGKLLNKNNNNNVRDIKKKNDSKPIIYKKNNYYKNILFDRSLSLFYSNVYHEKNQPNHLKIKNINIPYEINYKFYYGLEERYCPAGVYEFINIKKKIKLKINSQNCLHCKTCDIKDPYNNIEWTPPIDNGGPDYINM